MLTKIDRADVPSYRSAGKSPIRAFAAETAREFLERSEVGDVYEVTGIPEGMADGGVQRLAEAFRNELFYMDRKEDMRKHVKVMTRKNSRLFLERTKPVVWNREKGRFE